jgi:hypothetical protein
MHRRSLTLSVIVLGLVLTLVGGTGLFAAFTDTASTGTNSLTSGVRPRAADIQIVWPALNTADCAQPGNYVENSTTPGHTASDVQPGFVDKQGFCVRNVGVGVSGIAFRVIDRVETDIACTGDEAAAGDATCGGDQPGELGSVLAVNVSKFNCLTGDLLLNTGNGPLGNDPNTSQPEWTLGPSETWCGEVMVWYLDGTTLTDGLRAQSDRVTWKYQFVATVP